MAASMRPTRVTSSMSGGAKPGHTGRGAPQELDFQRLLDRMQMTMFDCKREPIEQ